MKKPVWIGWLFYLGFSYDAVLGAAFLIAGDRVFAWYGVPPPNHVGYVQFPAMLLLVFALLYLAVARNPIANRNLIPYGALLKVCYCTVVFTHWLRAGIPDMWKPFAWFDLAFLVLFVMAYVQLVQVQSRTTAAIT